MKPVIHLALVSFFVLLLAVLLIYFFLLVTPKISVQQPQAQEIIVLNKNCGACTNSLPDAMSALLKAYNYSIANTTVYLGTQTGNTIIEKNTITTLPSLIFPVNAMEQNSELAYLIDGMLYGNILTFNEDANEFSINTPFASAIFGPITYYSPLQNRTIESYSILNYTRIYSTDNATAVNILNPTTGIEEINSTPLTADNKTTIYFIYGDSPFTAMQSLILKDALMNFGSFSRNITSYSTSFNAGNSVYLGPQLVYEIGLDNYTSPYFQLEAYDISSLTNVAAQELVAQYDQNLFFTYNTSSPGNFEPMIDIGGKYILVSSLLKPTIFNNMNSTEINEKLATNATVSYLFNRSVLFIDALLCTYANSAPICNNQIVKGYKTTLK